jgi:hypothetical protein
MSLRDNHRPLVVMFRAPSGRETIIGAERRDVEPPFGGFDSHRLLDVMSRAPKSRMTIKKTKKFFFEIFVFCFLLVS